MRSRLGRKLQEEGGFTLIEMMIVVGVTAILGCLVTAGVYGYMTSAYMNRVNETARTVFLATQNYLTEQKQLGRLEEFNRTAQGFGGEVEEEKLREILLTNDADFDFEAFQDKYSTTTTRYILLEKGDGTTASDNPVYTVVKNYINDDMLLENTFLIEYDTRSGVVRSVFYSEKTDSFTYEGNHAEKANVILRSSDSLRKKRQGYYGVESTSLVRTDIDLYAPADVKLVNGERLYAEWRETNYLSQEDIANGRTVNANEAFDDTELRDYLVYDVVVCRQKRDGTGEVLFAVNNIAPVMSKGNTLAEADAAVTDKGIVLSYDEYSNKYQLLLDDIDHSIYDTYSLAAPAEGVSVTRQVLAEDMIFCRITERLAEHKDYEGESDSASTNLQSANFDGGAKEFSASGLETDRVEVGGNGNMTEDGSAAEYGKAFSIKNARQFNNMRYALADSCFIQTGRVDWQKPESDRTVTAADFEPFTFRDSSITGEAALSGGSTPLAAGGAAAMTGAVNEFAGTFQNGWQSGDNFTISNLTIEKLEGAAPEKNVGMFRNNTGVIKNLHLQNCEVRGAYLTGLIAGGNRGTISGVRIEDGSVEAVYYAGGVTGYNYTGSYLTDCQVEADVLAQMEPEAAVNSERVSEQEAAGEESLYGWYIGGAAGVNLGSMEQITTKGRTVSGLSCVGGLAGSNRTKEAEGIRGRVSEALGIGTGGSITDSINRNAVKTVRKNGVVYTGLIYRDFGGIVGSNEKKAEITDSTNEAIVLSGNRAGEPERDAANPLYLENVGGIAGRNAGMLKKCRYETDRPKELIQKLMTECFSAAEGGRLPVYSGVNVGGIAGLNTEDGVVDTCGSANAVVGYRNVGGVAGKNQGRLQTAVSDVNSRSIQGFVAATNASAGGVAGANEKQHITGWKNTATVMAGSLAGGITGANGGIGEYIFTAERMDADYYDKLLQPAFEETKPDMKVTDCENTGFVYVLERYGGGITGLNLGKIEKSTSIVNLSENSWLKDKLNSAYIRKIARADCVGGIAGANFGGISISSIVGPDGSVISGFPSTRAGVCGMDFIGGVTGFNDGRMEKIPNVTGEVYSAGKCVGGIVGLNRSTDSLKNIAVTDGMQIEGSYFVGGVLGMNIANAGETPRVSDMITKCGERRGSVRGTAYVGGILGYNTSLAEGGSLSELFRVQIDPLAAEAFRDYSAGLPESGAPAHGTTATVLEGCENNSEVYAARYLGGLLGYNSPDAPLYVIKSINYGSVAVTDKARTTDGYYFIGGVTGRNSMGGVIHECINDGSVQSPSKYLGGICEVNEGYIQFCTVGKSENYNAAGITGENSVGGLVGLNKNYIVRCSTSKFAKVTGGDNTGGIVGTNDVTGLVSGEAAKAVKVEGVISGGTSEEKECVSAGSVIGKDYTGGIAGLNLGQLEKVSVVESASIAGEIYVGGLIGSNEGTIIQGSEDAADKVLSHLESRAGKVVGWDEVGGIVGRHNAARIEQCTNRGDVLIVTGHAGTAGGITGSVSEGITVSGCINFGVVTANRAGALAGGITGRNEGEVKDCTNLGKAVSTDSQAGGIAGNNMGEITGCLNKGSAEGALSASENTAVGGIAGINEKEGTVQNCASKANETNTNAVTGITKVGGLIGYNHGRLVNDEEDEKKQEDNLLVTVSVKTPDQKVVDPGKDAACYLGGVIGRQSGKVKLTLKDYRYGGTLTVTKKGASQVQFVGGMIGESDGNTTLENCMLTGDILGCGNGSNNYAKGGVGALAGGCGSTVIVYPNEDGIYTATTEDSIVEGYKNVGGLIGKTQQGYLLRIKRNAGDQPKALHELKENTDADTSNDIYYTNLANVRGGVHVGGVYGHLKFHEKQLQYYRNGLAGDKDIASIQIQTGAKEYGPILNIGGIVGGTNDTEIKYQAAHLENYGTIGQNGSGGEDARRIGGIFGYIHGKNVGIDIQKTANYGNIYCGKEAIGGLAGSIDMSENAAADMGNTAWKSSIERFVNYGTIETKACCVGGLAGSVYYADITECSNEGSVTDSGSGERIGGLIGQTGSEHNRMPAVTITNCENKEQESNQLCSI